MAKVLLIDDDEIERLGRAVVLENLGHEVVNRRWSGVTGGDRSPIGADLVLLAIRPDEKAWDRFAQISAVREVRSRLDPRTRVAAMAWATVARNPMIDLRLATGGVTEILEPEQVACRDGLQWVVEDAERGRPARPTPRDLALWQVGPGSDPEAVLAWVAHRAQGDPAYWRAFEPGCNQNRCGLSRRQTFAVRAKVAEMGQLRFDPWSPTGGPARRHTSPRWSEVIRFVNLCRGVDPLEAVEGLDSELWAAGG